MSSSAVQDFLRKSHQQTRFASREKRREHYERLAAAYRSLNSEEVANVVAFALEAWDQGKRDLCEEVLLYLACLTPAGLAGHHGGLVQRQIVYPSEIYRGADAAARDALLEAFLGPGMEAGPLSLNLLMGALAWIGDYAVQQVFTRWQLDPPAWAGRVATEPALFAQVAGWELVMPGARRELCEPTCFQLVDARPGLALANQPVSVNIPRVDICAWCGDWLATLMDIHCQAPELEHLAGVGERLRVLFCRNCTVRAPTFGEVTFDGESRWSAFNELPEDGPGHRRDFPEGHLVLGPRRATPYEAHVLILSDGLSQIGGHPSWEHDAAYPECPSCHRTMPFVGQVDVSDLGTPEEGIYYAFLCRQCSVTAATFQTR
jgi:hypothetical protein